MATDAAVADMAPAHKMDHRENASAASTQTSKRDKRRCLLVDRIAQLDEKIGRGGRDQLYREQLQRIQIDTNLVMRVDPYADRPLDGFEEDEQKLWKMPVGGEHHGGPPRSLLEMAGPRFRDWIQEIQDLVEARDFALTKYKV